MAYKEPYMGPFKAEYIFYMVLALVLVAPLFRGLFFGVEFSVVHLYTAVLAGLYFLFNREQVRFSKNITDYAGLGLILAYAASFFVAWNTRDGIGELFKVINYFLVFWLVAKTAVRFELMRRLMWTLYLSGVIVAFIGIGSAFGTFTYNAAYLDGLICSTLQYHNATAIFMIAAGIIGLYLAISTENLKVKLAVAAGNYLLLITAIGAGSRGAMVVMPLVLLVQFIGLPKQDKPDYALSVLAVLITFIVTSRWVLTFAGQDEGTLWAILTLGMALAAGIQYFIGMINLSNINVNKKQLVVVTIIMFVTIGAVFAVKGTGILPERIVSRIDSMSFKENNILERVYFYKDAMKMIRDKPILGFGGGGWNAAYRGYQSYGYDSSEVHSYPLKVLVETGVLGFICYIALWLGITTSVIRILKKCREQERYNERLLVWNAYVAAVALCLHSLIDFSLSLGAVMIFLWALFGLIRGLDEQLATTEDYFLGVAVSRRFRAYLCGLLMFVFFAVNASFWLAGQNAQQAYAAVEEGQLSEAIGKIETAAKLDPFNGDISYNQALIYAELTNKGNALYQVKMMRSAQAAVEKKKGDYSAQILLAQLLIKLGDAQQATKEAETALLKEYFSPVAYEHLAQIYNLSADNYLKAGDQAKVQELVDKVSRIPVNMETKWNGLNEDEKILFKGTHLNIISPGLQKQLDIAKNIDIMLKKEEKRQEEGNTVN